MKNRILFLFEVIALAGLELVVLYQTGFELMAGALFLVEKKKKHIYGAREAT